MILLIKYQQQDPDMGGSVQCSHTPRELWFMCSIICLFLIACQRKQGPLSCNHTHHVNTKYSTTHIMSIHNTPPHTSCQYTLHHHTHHVNTQYSTTHIMSIHNTPPHPSCQHTIHHHTQSHTAST